MAKLTLITEPTMAMVLLLIARAIAAGMTLRVVGSSFTIRGYEKEMTKVLFLLRFSQKNTENKLKDEFSKQQT
jgi:hypothetical protein